MISSPCSKSSKPRKARALPSRAGGIQSFSVSVKNRHVQIGEDGAVPLPLREKSVAFAHPGFGQHFGLRAFLDHGIANLAAPFRIRSVRTSPGDELQLRGSGSLRIGRILSNFVAERFGFLVELQPAEGRDLEQCRLRPPVAGQVAKCFVILNDRPDLSQRLLRSVLAEKGRGRFSIAAAREIDLGDRGCR